jgi:hypothetical protein
MSKPDALTGSSSSERHAVCVPGFFLLFTTPLPTGFKGFLSEEDGFTPIPEASQLTQNRWRDAAQSHVLGAPFMQAARLERHPLGRIDLSTQKADEPRHADICLMAHVAGVALWEVWLPAPRQDFNPARWVEWLDINQEDSIAARIWHRLSTVNQRIAGLSGYGAYFPFSVIRLPDIELADCLGDHAEQVVSLLWRDRLTRPLKPEVVIDELARDTCARVGGMTLIGRRSALDLHDRHDVSATLEAEALELVPRSALPFLITLELLCIERAVLQGLYDRITYTAPHSIDDLIALKQDVMNGLEEYYGTTLARTRFSDVVAADGEAMLGIIDLFDAVTDRLDMVSFTLTTAYQKQMTALQFWLTVVFGATEIGFIASSIATWYYGNGLSVVLAWTIGASAVSGLILVALLRNKLAH